MSNTDFLLSGTIDAPSGETWDDLVLPAQSIKRLKEYANRVIHRDKVELEWGGKVSGGPVALFSGPSGTGKTYAAKVISNSFGYPLYRVDLGLLVNKYIGETEKNLNALFTAVANEPMVLLFDEADSLLSSRTEVQDAHDRYSNMVVSYLLSELERQQGPSILTSNSRQGIDPAFLRKMQMIFDFPRPDKIARSKLWRRYIPSKAPIHKSLDINNIAEKYELTGGQIRNVALSAAFMAAGESSPISLKHIRRAIKTELKKS